jgi:hypothetical protein
MQGVSQQNLIPLMSTSQVQNAEAQLIRHAASSHDTVIAVAMLVITCVLPVLFPLIPPLVEVAMRIALSPLLALHHVIALNYTLIKQNPPGFIITAIKANLLLWKGFILSQFLPYATSNWNCLRDCEHAAHQAYARMILLTMLGDSTWPEELEQRFVNRGVSLPCFFEKSLDLVAYNQAHLELEFFAPAPVEHIEPKFAPFHLRNEYFQNRVPNMAIPELPHGTDLPARFNEFWEHIDASWHDNIMINDDNIMRSKYDVIRSVRNFINSIETESRNNFSNIYCGQSLKTIRDALGQVVIRFMERKKTLDSMAESREKEKALKAWLLDGRSFVMSLSATCQHCIDRKLCDAIIFYQRYVIKKQFSSDDIDNSRLETQVFELLKEFRQELVQHACTNSIETDMHHAATERYVKSQLNRELGLGLPNALGAQDALTEYAIRSKVDEVRHLFYRLYTPQSIVRYFQKRITKQINEFQNQQVYMKIVEWFERQNPPRQAADVFDAAAMAFKEDAIIELFTSLEVIGR